MSNFFGCLVPKTPFPPSSDPVTYLHVGRSQFGAGVGDEQRFTLRLCTVARVLAEEGWGLMSGAWLGGRGRTWRWRRGRGCGGWGSRRTPGRRTGGPTTPPAWGRRSSCRAASPLGARLQADTSRCNSGIISNNSMIKVIKTNSFRI